MSALIRSLTKAYVIFVFLLIAGMLAFMLMTGARTNVIMTGSMQPTLPVGSVVLDVPTSHLVKGEIITFHSSNGLVSHRFIGYWPDGGIKTKGDANLSADPHFTPMQQSAVVGRVALGGFWFQWEVLAAGFILWVLCLISWITGGTKSQKDVGRRSRQGTASAVTT